MPGFETLCQMIQGNPLATAGVKQPVQALSIQLDVGYSVVETVQGRGIVFPLFHCCKPSHLLFLLL